MSTISPSGWSCAQRRVGRVGVRRWQHQQRTDGRIVRRLLVGVVGVAHYIEDAVGLMHPTTRGWNQVLG